MTLAKSLRTIAYKTILGSSYREYIPENERHWIEVNHPYDLEEGDLISLFKPNSCYEIDDYGDFKYGLVERNKNGNLERRIFYVNQNKFNFPITFRGDLPTRYGIWKLVKIVKYDPDQEPEDDCL